MRMKGSLEGSAFSEVGQSSEVFGMILQLSGRQYLKKEWVSDSLDL